ncbi:uncharacterized protein LOC128347083 isoform X2 [Hemicordylus capensis]|uniref:uncharacterized protein LOC128347083 isoform X2 n=1 Tax=Hemicordylus capensis TaxID=884348 RepID=UPI002302EF64|nr:uncharacterized protein LOC128347083 isoform X2 [Hemicordylus capensis]
MKILLIVLVLLCCTLVKGFRCYSTRATNPGQVSENDFYENTLMPSKRENKEKGFQRLERSRDNGSCILALLPTKFESDDKKSYLRILSPARRDSFEECNTKTIVDDIYEYSCCNTDACNPGLRYLESVKAKTLTCYYGHTPVEGSDNGFCVSGSSPGYRNNDIVGFRREDFEKCNTKLRYAGDRWRFSCCTTDRCNPLIKAKRYYNI